MAARSAPQASEMSFAIGCARRAFPRNYRFTGCARRRLAEAGCTVHEIAAVTGHKTLSEIERYTREAEKTRLAESGMGKVVNMLGRTKKT
jgi:hypothetical protein